MSEDSEDQESAGERHGGGQWRGGGASGDGGGQAHDTGYGHSPAQVAKVRVDSADLLTGYYDAVHEQTLEALRGLAAKDLERVVDERWDPPVTLGVRLVSVLSDDLQHIGQAAYVKGLTQRTG